MGDGATYAEWLEGPQGVNNGRAERSSGATRGRPAASSGRSEGWPDVARRYPCSVAPPSACGYFRSSGRLFSDFDDRGSHAACAQCTVHNARHAELCGAPVELTRKITVRTRLPGQDRYSEWSYSARPVGAAATAPGRPCRAPRRVRCRTCPGHGRAERRRVRRGTVDAARSRSAVSGRPQRGRARPRTRRAVVPGRTRTASPGPCRSAAPRRPRPTSGSCRPPAPRRTRAGWRASTGRR